MGSSEDLVCNWLYVQFLFLHLPHFNMSVLVPCAVANWASLIASLLNFSLSSFTSSLAISSAVIVANLKHIIQLLKRDVLVYGSSYLCALIAPILKLVLKVGFLMSFKLEILDLILFLYLMSVFLNSWKMASSNSSANSSALAQPH